MVLYVRRSTGPRRPLAATVDWMDGNPPEETAEQMDSRQYCRHRSMRSGAGSRTEFMYSLQLSLMYL